LFLSVIECTEGQHIEIYTAETSVAEPSPLEFEIAIPTLERYKSPSIA
jgi:hypothetical protein